jgi:hypothetical protein
VRANGDLHSAVLFGHAIQCDPAGDGVRSGERPDRIVLVPMKRAALVGILDNSAVLQKDNTFGIHQLTGDSDNHRVFDDATKTLISFPQIEEKRN